MIRETRSDAQAAESSAKGIFDLRSALDLLERNPRELLTTREPVDPIGELAAVYAKVAAGTPVKPPTKSGPAMLFKTVKGYDIPVLVGVHASRRRVAMMMGCASDQLAPMLTKALESPLSPVPFDGANAPCQEVVHTSPVDIPRLLPAPTNTPLDAGPYFGMGLIRAEDPETGQADVTIHRLCIQGPDLLTVYLVPGRHIELFRMKAEAMGRSLPISINMGLDPAIYVSACFEPPTTPAGFDELRIAGALRGRPVELVDCISVPTKAIARAEIVLEGEILPHERMREDEHSRTGFAMPEFPGYMGEARQALPVIKVKAVTHRRDPILQTIVGPGLEHCNLAGIPTEAAILRLIEAGMPGRVSNVYAHPAGGGKYLAVIQFTKDSPVDEGRQRQAALMAFSAFSELKHVILVDEDVDIYDTNDVLWAMTTRYQGDVSTVFIPGVRCHPLDPSQSPQFSPSIPAPGISCKTIFDCTVPYHLKETFRRAPFQDVDISRFIDQ
jgi:4-hydroxy-3-polyprenylbenzoate decarboxylase